MESRNTIRASKADSTWSHYDRCWKKFREFCCHFSIKSLPAEVDTVCAFLQQVKVATNSAHSVVMHAASISAYHTLSRFQSPTKEECVQSLIKGCKRLLGKPVIHKAPITKEILKNIISSCVGSDVRKSKGTFLKPLNLWRQAIFESAQ